MTYTHLSKLYYKNEAEWQAAYDQRFRSFGTRHFGVELRQYQRPQCQEAFLCTCDDLVLLVQEIYTLMGKLLLLKNSMPQAAMEQFILQSIAEEIKSTNDIEGVRSTRREIRAWLERLPETAQAPHLQSIIEKYCRISEGKEIPLTTCQDIRVLYDGFVLDEVINEDAVNYPDGKIFRKDKVEIQGSVIGKAVHQGVYPEGTIIAYMDKALAILADQSMPILLRIAVFHYLFAYIHPFYDGNGRMDRFISSYCLAQEFDATVALRLSVVIKKQRNNYYKQFMETDSAINKGDLTPFCIYFLELVKEAFTETITVLQRKAGQLAKYKQLLEMIVQGTKEQQLYRLLLEASLFYGMGLTMKQILAATGYARVTVQKLLDKMPQEHLLTSKIVKPYRYKLNLLALQRFIEAAKRGNI